jgi:hypothetical protein
MSLRISSGALALLVLAGCGEQSPQPGGGIPMDCATGGAAGLAPVCSVYEQKAMDEDAFLVIWRPDGGFRRVRYSAADSRVAVLDGAEQASGVMREADGSVSFIVDGDRYRLPADFAKRLASQQAAPE